MERRLIDASELETEFAGPFVQTYRDCREALRNAPTIDAVEVARCRECKYCLVQIPLPDGYLYCQELNRAVSDNDYCSRGARREPDGE